LADLSAIHDNNQIDDSAIAGTDTSNNNISVDNSCMMDEAGDEEEGTEGDRTEQESISYSLSSSKVLGVLPTPGKRKINDISTTDADASGAWGGEDSYHGRYTTDAGNTSPFNTANNNMSQNNQSTTINTTTDENSLERSNTSVGDRSFTGEDKEGTNKDKELNLGSMTKRPRPTRGNQKAQDSLSQETPVPASVPVGRSMRRMITR
jgi:hypothetical protein